MKQLSISLFIVIVAMSLLLYRSCSLNNSKDEQLKELTLKCDSILNLPPKIDTVTTIIKGETKYITHIIESESDPKPCDFEIYQFKDSTVNNEIDCRLTIYGACVQKVDWNYKPTTKQVEVTKEIKVPVIVSEPITTPKQKNYSFHAGINSQLYPVVGAEYKRIGLTITAAEKKPIAMIYYKF